MKSKDLKVYNLPADNKCIYSIDAKPYFFLTAVLLSGIIGVFLGFGIYAGVIIALAVIFIFITPKLVLIDFFQDYLVLYNKANRNDCALIYYEDIVSWNYEKGVKQDLLHIELIDGTVETVEGYSRYIYEFYLNQFIKDKQGTL